MLTEDVFHSDFDDFSVSDAQGHFWSARGAPKITGGVRAEWLPRRSENAKTTVACVQNDSQGTPVAPKTRWPACKIAPRREKRDGPHAKLPSGHPRGAKNMLARVQNRSTT